MHNSIPCLDHPSRSAAIRALNAEGQSHRQIADAVGVDNAVVVSVLQKVGPTMRPPQRIPHRAKVDPNRIVSGVLPASVRSLREPPPASDRARGRTIQAMTTPRFQLQRPDGLYLRLDAAGFVAQPQYGWIGFAKQLKTLQGKRPELAVLAVVTVSPPSRGAFKSTATR